MCNNPPTYPIQGIFHTLCKLINKKLDKYKSLAYLCFIIKNNHNTMEISTTTMEGKTGLEVEALIIAAVKSGVTNFTSDLPLDIFDPSLIGSQQWDADGLPYTDLSGFNVGEWDAVAARVSALSLA